MENHSRGGSLWEMLDASFIRIPVGAAQLLAVIVRAPLLAAQLATDIISVPFLLAQIVVAHLRDQTERMDARLQDTVTGLIGQRNRRSYRVRTAVAERLREWAPRRGIGWLPSNTPTARSVVGHPAAAPPGPSSPSAPLPVIRGPVPRADDPTR